MLGIATPHHGWDFANPPPLQKEYKQHLHIPFSAFPHLQLKGSKVNLASGLPSPSFPRPLENCWQSVRVSWDRFGNGSCAGRFCREGGPHRSWKSGSPGRMSLGHSHTRALHDDRFPRPTLPTPCLTTVLSPGKESRRAYSWHLAPPRPHPQHRPRAENVPRADVQVKPFWVSSAPVISSHGPDPGPPPPAANLRLRG